MIIADRFFSSEQLFEMERNPSLYENTLRFKITRKTNLGLIMMFFDKREDKTIALDRIKQPITLFAENDLSTTLVITRMEHRANIRSINIDPLISPPEVTSAEITLLLNSSALPDRLRIRFTTARSINNFSPSTRLVDFQNWLAINLSRIKLGILARDNNIILDLDIHEQFQRAAFTNVFEAEIGINSNTPFYDRLKDMINENSRQMEGTSLWFEGATGLVNIAEVTLFNTQ